MEWTTYYDATIDKPLHPLVLGLEPWLRPGMNAVDLGCGVGTTTLWLAEHGLTVRAIDGEPEAIDRLRLRLPAELPVQTEVARFEALALDPASVDLIVAQFSLFFVPPEAYDAVWANVRTACRPGARFVGQFLGPNDDWKDRGYTLHDRTALDRLFADWRVVELEEVDRDGTTSVGNAKHWHVFHVMAERYSDPM